MQKTSTKAFIVFAFALITADLFAQTVTTPRTPSPAASVTQTVGISTVAVSYSRPSVKNRPIWGSQVPYGWTLIPGGGKDVAPWRAGANENTVITFSDAAKVQGQDVPAGSYGLFFVVNADDSGEIVLSKDYTSWGNYFYDPSHDLLRAKITLRNGPMTEMLTYEFGNDTKTSTELVLSWEKKQFPVKIEFAVDDIVLANAEKELKGLLGFGWQGYASAANYCLFNNVSLDKGMVWIDQAIARHKDFNVLSTKAGLLAKAGKTEEAAKINREALDVATENDLNTLGYNYLAQNDFDKGIETLAVATQRYPKSANAWDSLGEAYFLKGDKKNAKANFSKALTLNPPAATKANSEKYLRQIDGK
jgi:Protein of unknown function (DUF2911)/Tetratricopeptide repeat